MNHIKIKPCIVENTGWFIFWIPSLSLFFLCWLLISKFCQTHNKALLSQSPNATPLPTTSAPRCTIGRLHWRSSTWKLRLVLLVCLWSLWSCLVCDAYTNHFYHSLQLFATFRTFLNTTEFFLLPKIWFETTSLFPAVSTAPVSFFFSCFSITHTNTQESEAPSQRTCNLQWRGESKKGIVCLTCKKVHTRSPTRCCHAPWRCTGRLKSSSSSSSSNNNNSSFTNSSMSELWSVSFSHFFPPFFLHICFFAFRFWLSFVILRADTRRPTDPQCSVDSRRLQARVRDLFSFHPIFTAYCFFFRFIIPTFSFLVQAVAARSAPVLLPVRCCWARVCERALGGPLQPSRRGLGCELIQLLLVYGLWVCVCVFVCVCVCVCVFVNYYLWKKEKNAKIEKKMKRKRNRKKKEEN